MQVKAKFTKVSDLLLPYFRMEESLINRGLARHLPSVYNQGKLLSSLILQARLGNSNSAPAPTIYATVSKSDEDLLQRVCQQSPHPRFFPVSYELFIEHLFGRTGDDHLVFAQAESPFLDNRWQASDFRLINVEAKFENIFTESAYGIQPVVVEETFGKHRLFDFKERSYRRWLKFFNAPRNTQSMDRVSVEPGWACGLLQIKRQKETNSLVGGKALHSRYHVDELNMIEEVIKESLIKFSARLSDIRFLKYAVSRVDVLEHLQRSQNSYGEARLGLPDLAFGWNPIASVSSLFMDNRPGLHVLALVENFPVVDIFVVQHA